MDGNSTFGNPVLDLVVVVILILVGGFFAASEMALITVKRYRLNQLADDGNRAARTAQRLVEDPSRFLATIQIAITFLGFLSGAVGAVAFSSGTRRPDQADAPAAGLHHRLRGRDRLRDRDAPHRAGLDHHRRAGAEDAGPQLPRAPGPVRRAPDRLHRAAALADRVGRLANQRAPGAPAWAAPRSRRAATCRSRS